MSSLNPFSIYTAKAQLKATAAMFSEAGLDLEAMLKLNDPTALRAHLADLQAASKPAAPVALTAEHPEVSAFIAAALAPVQAQLREQGVRATAINAGLSAAGIQLADTLSAAETGPALTAAVNDRAMLKAQEELAKRGLAKFPGSAPVVDPTKPPLAKGPELTGRARTEAAFKAQSAARAA